MSGATVAPTTIIPIVQTAVTADSGLTVAGNGIVLPAGTYLVSYFANGAVPTGNLSTSLYLDGAPITGESIVLTPASATDNVGASKTALITTTGGTLSLYNTSTDTATLSNASLTVLQMG